MLPAEDSAAGRQQANDVEIRMAALDAASRIHHRVSVPNSTHSTTTKDDTVLRSAVAFEKYLRTGEYDAQ